MTYVTSLTLRNFRSYETGRIEGLTATPIILHGANGAGKTNLLEAVSFLAPGRGLRSAKSADIQRITSRGHEGGTGNDARPWALAAKLETAYGETKIGTGADPAKAGRLIRINGADASQSRLGEYLSLVWLTPQMDRLFLESAGARRRFLDRLIFAFDPAHAGRVNRYEKTMAQRSKILREHHAPDTAWLDALESGMAETGVAIAAARLDFAQKLQQACNRAAANEEILFPKAVVRVAGLLEQGLGRKPALEMEAVFKEALKASRTKDAITGGAAEGPHKSDLAVRYAAKNMPADQCSTGEQKALLIGLILAHSRLITAERGSPPLLLLDEVAAHLDENRRKGLYDLLLAMNIQVWMTGTDKALFEAIAPHSRMIAVAPGRLSFSLQDAA